MLKSLFLNYIFGTVRRSFLSLEALVGKINHILYKKYTFAS